MSLQRKYWHGIWTSIPMRRITMFKYVRLMDPPYWTWTRAGTPMGTCNLGCSGRRDRSWSTPEKALLTHPIIYEQSCWEFWTAWKIALQDPDLHYKWVDSVYPDHTSSLCEAGLSPSIVPTMGKYGHISMKKWIANRRMTQIL